MIGNPTDFRHTGHIGSGEMATKQNVCVSRETEKNSEKERERESNCHAKCLRIEETKENNKVKLMEMREEREKRRER